MLMIVGTLVVLGAPAMHISLIIHFLETRLDDVQFRSFRAMTNQLCEREQHGVIREGTHQFPEEKQPIFAGQDTPHHTLVILQPVLFWSDTVVLESITSHQVWRAFDEQMTAGALADVFADVFGVRERA